MVAPEIAQERVAVDHDPVGEAVLRDGASVVEPVGAAPAAAVGDDDGDVLERTVRAGKA